MQKKRTAAKRPATRKTAKPARGTTKRVVRPLEKANQITKSSQIWAWDLEELFSSPRKRSTS